jgi:hypothetical protein
MSREAYPGSQAALTKDRPQLYSSMGSGRPRGSSPTVKEGSPLPFTCLPGALLDSRATAPGYCPVGYCPVGHCTGHYYASASRLH